MRIAKTQFSQYIDKRSDFHDNNNKLKKVNFLFGYFQFIRNTNIQITEGKV